MEVLTACPLPPHMRTDCRALLDTVAAGDAFCGGLASGLARGATMAEAMRWGAAAGALAATIKGAVPSLPSLNKVTELLER